MMRKAGHERGDSKTAMAAESLAQRGRHVVWPASDTWRFLRVPSTMPPSYTANTSYYTQTMFVHYNDMQRSCH